MLDLIKMEDIGAIASMVAAVASVASIFVAFHLNKEAAWKIIRINDNTWRLERRGMRRVALIGLAVIPLYDNYEAKMSGINRKFFKKDDSCLITITPKSSSFITSSTNQIKIPDNLRLFVYSKNVIFRRLNQNVYNDELTTKIVNHYIPSCGSKGPLDKVIDGFLLEIKNKEKTEPSKKEQAKNKSTSFWKGFSLRIKTKLINDWYGDLH